MYHLQQYYYTMYHEFFGFVYDYLLIQSLQNILYIMSKQRNPWKLTKVNKNLKLFCFDTIFIFLNNRITNPTFLLILDLLQIITLVCFYFNPIFTHLLNQQLFSYYFNNLYPYFYFFHQETTVQNYPICSIIFTVSFIMLILYRKTKPNIIIFIVQIAIALVPILVCRIASQIVNLIIRININGINNGVQMALAVLSFVFILVGMVMEIISLVGYDKIQSRGMDFIISVLLFSKINSYAIIALLALKIILTYFIVPQQVCKYTKMRIQGCLLFTIILMLFISGTIINYIMLATLFIICFFYEVFTIFVYIKNQEVELIGNEVQQQSAALVSNQKYTKIKDTEKQKDKQQQKDKEIEKSNKDEQRQQVGHFNYNQLQYLKKIQFHMKTCAILQCNCRQVIKMKNSNELRAWAKNFHKQQAKINSQNAINNPGSSNNLQKFCYIALCTQQQHLNFATYLTIYKLPQTNLQTQYYKYHYLKIYRLHLLKDIPKILKISMINQEEDSNPYDDLLQLQNKIHKLISKVRLFWNRLIDKMDGKIHQNIPMSIIQQISEDIDEVNSIYESIQASYDEKQQADYYYSIFKLIILQQQPSSILLNHQPNYLLITNPNKIINMTANLTNILQKPKSQLIGHNYGIIVPSMYFNHHHEWVKKYLQDYEIGQNQQFVKVMALNSGMMKVMKMSHVIVENYGLGQQLDQEKDSVLLQQQVQPQSSLQPISQSLDSIPTGINIITIMHNSKQPQYQISSDNKLPVFYILVNRDNLDIISYQPAIFTYYNIKPTIQQINKLHRANLKQLFPNLNRQAILHSTGRPLIAKQNKKFFQADQQIFRLSESLKESSEDNLIISKRKMERLLQVKQIPSSKNKQLNLLLLSFSMSSQSQKDKYMPQKNKNNVSYSQLQKQICKQKTLQAILDEQKQKQKGKQPGKDRQTYQNNVNQQKFQKNTIIQFILCVTFFSILGIFITLLLIVQLQFNEIKPFLITYENKSQFYTELQYTKAYFLGLAIGENKINQMQQYWSYNENYADIFTVFAEVQHQVFSKRFNYYIQLFSKKPTYSELIEQVQLINTKIAQKIDIAYILFWCCLVLIIINFIESIAIFIQGELKSKKILTSFLAFEKGKIEKNLRRLDQLQTILQIKQCINQIQTQTNQIKRQQSQIFQMDIFTPKQNPFLQNPTKQKPILQNSNNNLKQIKKKRNNKSNSNLSTWVGFPLKKQRKSHFQSILNQYLPNSESKNEQMGCQTSDIMLNKGQLNNTFIRRSKKNVVKQPNKLDKYVKSSAEQQYKQLKISIPICQTLNKNLAFMIPSIIGFILKLSITFFLYFYIQSLLSSTRTHVQLNHNLTYAPVYILTTIQNQYINNTINTNKIAQYQHNVNILIKQFIKQNNNKQFIKFIQFQNQILKQTNLCQFVKKNSLDYSLDGQVYEKCVQNNRLFIYGMDSLIQYIQEKLRQIKIGVLPKSYMKQDNQINTALKICLHIQQIRSKIFAKQYATLYSSQTQIITWIQIAVVFISCVCLFLQSRQLTYTAIKTKRTKNLFKIVPHFMKQAIQQEQNTLI